MSITKTFHFIFIAPFLTKTFAKHLRNFNSINAVEERHKVIKQDAAPNDKLSILLQLCFAILFAFSKDFILPFHDMFAQMFAILHCT